MSAELAARDVPEPDAEATAEAALLGSWESSGRGLRGWLCDVSHRAIGKRYIVTAFIFFLLGGLEALAMRLQLARPESTLLDADLYNQVFTMHGSTMMFLFAVPVMGGVGLYVVPLMIGSRDTAFPRLSAYSYYTYLLGGLLLYISFFLNMAPDAGWFSYVPLAGPDYSPGKRVDVWAQLISFTEIAGLALAVNLTVTILKHRAPGMSLDRMPLFVWAMLIQSLMVIFGMPSVMLGSFMLATDRLIGTHFFNYGEGGDVLLFQHLFWFFGHPEVYIIFVPALGMLSTMLVTFTRRQLFGYPAVVLANVATGFIGFGVWVHHMFATGIPQLASGFFTAASILITIPTGVQFFCWIAMLMSGNIRLTTPMLFCLGFFGVFVLGGVTGVMLASVPLDLQLHDTHFVVAHLHYVLLGGGVFPLIGAVYYWFPKMTGRLLGERLGRWNFATFFIGFNLVFFPLHVLGLRGMPRRVFSYPEGRGWDDLNLLATVGAGVLFVSVLLLLVNVWRSLRGGQLAGSNPWGADTLEWSAASPPAPYGFLHLPVVTGRHPLWTAPAHPPRVRGLRTDRRELLVTKILDAEPDHRQELPGSTPWPLVASLGTAVLFIVAIFTPWGVIIGAPLIGLALVGWYWPRVPFKEELAPEQPRRWQATADARESRTVVDQKVERDARGWLDVSRLASTVFGSRGTLWWGVVGMVVIEGMVMALLFVSYFYLRDRAVDWPPTPLASQHFLVSGAGTLVLLVSALPMYLSVAAAKRGALRPMRRRLIAGALLGLLFCALRYFELQLVPFRWDSHAHGSLFWVIGGMHFAHGLISVLETVLMTLVLFVGPVQEKHLVDVEANALYWYFVVVLGALVYAVLYLDPMVLAR
jgi:cytochrome c oxidase subunit I+III